MGTLLGHALPGSFFLLFGLWRLLQICYRLRLVEIAKRRSSRNSEKRVTFFTSASYPCCLVWCARFPLEGLTKIVATSIGMGGELWASTDYGRAGKIKWMGDIQHVTMYGLFCLSGIVDVLWWKRVRFCPPGLDFLALANAFVGEWILFSSHLHGRSSLDVLLHTLLLYVIAATVLTIILEYKFDKSLMASLATTYLLFVQGTWFILVGVILYAQIRWTAWLQHESKEGDQNMIATMLFASNIGGNFVLVLLLFVSIRFVLQFSCQPRRWEKLWDAQLKSSSSYSETASFAHLCRDNDANEQISDVTVRSDDEDTEV